MTATQITTGRCAAAMLAGSLLVAGCGSAGSDSALAGAARDRALHGRFRLEEES
jgi:hypothetical protein